MEFLVAPHVTYVVKIVDYRPRNKYGQECDAIAEYDRHEVLVYAALKGEVRCHAVAHEVGHAWDYYRRTAQDDESQTDDRAFFMRSYQRDLKRQGGEEALCAMLSPMEQLLATAGQKQAGDRELVVEPMDDDLQRDWPATPSAFSTQCGRCTTSIAPGNIVRSEIELHASEKRTQRFSVYCEFCNHLMTWQQECDSDGYPVPDSQPIGHEYVTDPEQVATFLKEHPLLCG